MKSPSARSWFSDYTSSPKQGPLPALLLVLTVTTGIVDAVSILSLGRVFVANMTGNVVFIGFALAHSPGFSLSASFVALGGFLAGAGGGGVVISRFGRHRGRLLLVATSAEVVLLLLAALVLALAAQPYSSASRDTVVAAAALALGLQNAAARRLAVPDFTTTVLTMTLTGIAADLRDGSVRVAARRMSSVVTMLLGAIVGAELVLHHHAAAAMFVACGAVALVAGTLALSVRTDAEWHKT